MALAAERADYALQKAMEQFWAVGIEATPYPELVKVTGLSRKALYQQWPDKRGWCMTPWIATANPFSLINARFSKHLVQQR